MTDLRTVAQQALEYMKSIGQMDMYPEDWAIVGRLEAALAQQAEPGEPVEPYCYIYEYDGAFGLHREFYPKVYNGHKPDRTVPVYTAPPQQPEPVADLFNCPKCGRHDYGMHGACPTCDAQQAEPSECSNTFGCRCPKHFVAQQAEPVDTDCHTQGICQRSGYGIGQQAEPVEPVAWLYTGIKQDGTEHGPHLVWKPEYMDAMSASKGAKATPLYTSPPQRKED